MGSCWARSWCGAVLMVILELELRGLLQGEKHRLVLTRSPEPRRLLLGTEGGEMRSGSGSWGRLCPWGLVVGA